MHCFCIRFINIGGIEHKSIDHGFTFYVAGTYEYQEDEQTRQARSGIGVGRRPRRHSFSLPDAKPVFKTTPIAPDETGCIWNESFQIEVSS